MKRNEISLFLLCANILAARKGVHEIKRHEIWKVEDTVEIENRYNR